MVTCRGDNQDVSLAGVMRMRRGHGAASGSENRMRSGGKAKDEKRGGPSVVDVETSEERRRRRADRRRNTLTCNHL